MLTLARWWLPLCRATPTTGLAESTFLRSLRDSVFKVIPLVAADWDRMADLVDEYADLPLGTSDASVIAVAERLGVVEIATLDHRHFRIVRPRHVSAFTLLPG